MCTCLQCKSDFVEHFHLLRFAQTIFMMFLLVLKSFGLFFCSSLLGIEACTGSINPSVGNGSKVSQFSSCFREMTKLEALDHVPVTSADRWSADRWSSHRCAKNRFTACYIISSYCCMCCTAGIKLLKIQHFGRTQFRQVC